MKKYRTRTGGFPIGFRRGWSDWQHGSLPSLAKWAYSHGFGVLDLMNLKPADLNVLSEAGVELGSLDLLNFDKLMANDAGVRRECIRANVEYVKEMASAGVRVFFTCVIPGDPARARRENYKLAVESFAPVAEECARRGASLAIEGWPGMPPYFANLCCNPETLRAFLKDIPSGVGVNYDPSHLIRLGIDHLRFLREFAPHVRHVHAKDTALDPEAEYEFGSQGAAFAAPHGFGEWKWRYTIPGHGAARWSEIFDLLADASYAGAVSIELEDENFNGTEEGEKKALKLSAEFLAEV
jgi:sugar phosphate isomerase/epimerase